MTVLGVGVCLVWFHEANPQQRGITEQDPRTAHGYHHKPKQTDAFQDYFIKIYTHAFIRHILLLIN